MAALITINLTEAQRNALLSLQGERYIRTDKYGNEVRITIENWKDVRVYVNFSIKGKRVEYTYLSLTDANDVKIQFDGDAMWLLLDAIIADEIKANSIAAEIEPEIISSEGEVVRVAFPQIDNEVVDAAVFGMHRGDIIIPSDPMLSYIGAWGRDGSGRSTVILSRDRLPFFVRRIAEAHK